MVLPSRSKTGIALAVYPAGLSGLRDLATPLIRRKVRAGQVVFADPNTNVNQPRTAIPTLLGEHIPGEHWLMCAVLGLPGMGTFEEQWEDPPTLDRASDFNNRIVIRYQNKEQVVTVQNHTRPNSRW